MKRMMAVDEEKKTKKKNILWCTLRCEFLHKGRGKRTRQTVQNQVRIVISQKADPNSIIVIRSPWARHWSVSGNLSRRVNKSWDMWGIKLWYRTEKKNKICWIYDTILHRGELARDNERIDKSAPDGKRQKRLKKWKERKKASKKKQDLRFLGCSRWKLVLLLAIFEPPLQKKDLYPWGEREWEANP